MEESFLRHRGNSLEEYLFFPASGNAIATNSVGLQIKEERFRSQVCKYVAQPIAFISLHGCQYHPLHSISVWQRAWWVLHQNI